MEHQRRADLMLLLATSFWGISNCLTAICLRDMQPLTLNAFRFLTAFVVLGFVFRKNVFHASCETVKYSIVVGLSLVVVYTSVTYGVIYTSVSNAGFICALSVVTTPILEFIVYRKKPEKKFGVSMILCLIGLALMTLNETLKPAFGDIICLFAAVLGTVAMVLAVMRGDGTIVDQFAKSSGTLTVIGGAGLVVGSFVSGGTATPNFSRFAKSGKVGAITTVIAFFIGNSLMFFFGGVSSVYVGGNDIFEVMINLGLFYLAILVLGLNIWTTNDNALYSAGLGLANIFGQKKKPMVLVSGIIGTVLAVWLYWNFCGWLNILNCTLPPVGIILVLGYFLNKEKYQDVEVSENVNWFAVIGVVLGAVVANLVHWGIASINGMVVAAVCYLIGRAVEKK